MKRKGINKGGIGIKKSDEKILVALMETRTIDQAAKAAEVSKSTINRRLKDPEFAERYYQERMKMLKTHTASLHGLLDAAIFTMGQIMANNNNPPQTRLNAAESIIRHAMKMTETVLFAERLDAIEKKLKGED